MISVTGFFRDPEAFDYLAKNIIRDLVQNCAPGKPIRIWVPACATGEEAYSLAMLVIEKISTLRKDAKLQVFASDVDEHALAVARAGVYLRAGIVEPQFQTPARPSKLDPFASRLSGWLVTELRKSRKERRTAKQMPADLVQLGFDGSYERVAAFVRAWKGDRQRAQRTTDRGTFVPLVFQPGEAFQFDWSEDWAYVGGERIKLQVAHIKLSHSRAFLVRAYLLQTHEMLFDAHWHAFRVFGGIPSRGIYDNMKTAVDRVGVGKKRDVNARFLSMTSHYVFEPEFCNPAAGWEKGQVEKSGRDARHRLWQVVPAFSDLGTLNDWLEERCKVLWAETAHGSLPPLTHASMCCRATGSIADIWEAEKPSLMPLPTAFDGFVEQSKRVSPTCLITFDRNRYSVPASFANRLVSLHIYPERLVIVAEGQVICTHERIIERSHRQPGRVIYGWWTESQPTSQT